MPGTVPRDQGALLGDPGAELELGQARGGTFMGGPEFHREIQEAKSCNTKLCGEAERGRMNGDLKNENPQRP